jgi:hypothetical protein
VIPIVVLCKDRVRYLDTTLKSLSATVPSAVPVFVVNDATTDPSMTRYLTGDRAVPISEPPFPHSHPQWKRRIGELPEPAEVAGIGGKVGLLLGKSPGGTRNLGLAVMHAFEATGADYVIRVEDDVLFKAGWYERLAAVTSELGDAGIISGFRYFFRQPQLRPAGSNAEALVRGYGGGCLMAASRQLYLRRRRLFENDVRSMKHNDVFWIENCRQAGLRTYVTALSLCQHIGVVSTFTDRGHKQYIVNGRLAKIAPDVTPPFPLAAAVSRFGNCGAEPFTLT